MSPPVFVNYRRADEPYAAALIHAVLTDRWEGDPVFLDTRFLRQRGDVGRELLDAVGACDLVLAVIGPGWDAEDQWKRLMDPDDWVRRELVEAAEAGKSVVPVLVDRPAPPTDLPFTPVPEWADPVHVTRTDFWSSSDALAARIAPFLGALPRADRPPATPRQLIEPAVDAMLRHVLPGPQRRMDNDAMIARVVAAELDERDWLRFAAAANQPGRPNGSGITWATTSYLGLADLGEDFRPRTPVRRIPRTDIVRIDRHDHHRLWKRVSDLRFTLRDGSRLDVNGFFADEADELVAELEPPR